MNRRGFLKLLPVAIGGIAAAEAIPFNRVWSFPKNIVVPKVKVLDLSRDAFLKPGDVFSIASVNRINPAPLTGIDLGVPGSDKSVTQCFWIDRDGQIQFFPATNPFKTFRVTALISTADSD